MTTAVLPPTYNASIGHATVRPEPGEYTHRGGDTLRRMLHSASVTVFIAQIVVLLAAGRLIGELLQRVGQPTVTGQILAGVLLGPSVLGTLAPGLWHSLFPATPEQKAMLDGVSQLGILLLLLMTGMETDLAVFRTARRPAVYVSVCGIVVPFACGCALGALLPASMLPTSGQRLISALFLGTALSISSVKIVALVIRDLGFLRRTVGQVILASSILDDTIGWVIVSITLGLALYGTVDAAALARTLLGTALFLVLSFTVGRRLVVRVVRWSNDVLTSELATVTTILIITGLMALLTDALGVHFVLGAFVAGILLGQSPLLTKHVDAPLRGLIVALFMPVFFAVAGLSINLAALTQPRFLWLTLALIVLASIGKFVGAFVGGRAGGLTYAESFAVGLRRKRARFHRGDRCLDRPAAEGAEPGPVYRHRRHGGRDDHGHAADVALGLRPPAHWSRGTSAARA